MDCSQWRWTSGQACFTGPGGGCKLTVRANHGGAFTALAPRQAILSAPYALVANTALTVPGTLTNAQSNAVLAGTFTGVFYGNGAAIANLPSSGSAIFNVRNYGTNVGTGSAAVDSAAILAAYHAWIASPVAGFCISLPERTTTPTLT